jgi:hypothetical protein
LFRLRFDVSSQSGIHVSQVFIAARKGIRFFRRLLIVMSVVKYFSQMETIQIVLETELRIAADKAALRCRLNRSQLVLEALREYLLRLETRAREESDREGYRKSPSVRGEAQAWESEAAWPPC